MTETLAAFFVWHPGHIFAIAGIFGALAVVALLAKLRFPEIACVPWIVAAAAWFGYGLWEYEAMIERANIRIDLLILWPVLFGITLLCVIVSTASVAWAAVAYFGDTLETPAIWKRERKQRHDWHAFCLAKDRNQKTTA
jgi:hypothetical protein